MIVHWFCFPCGIKMQVPDSTQPTGETWAEALAIYIYMYRSRRAIYMCRSSSMRVFREIRRQQLKQMAQLWNMLR